MLDVRLGRAAEIDGTTPAERDDVARASRVHHLSAKAYIGVARHKLLRFADRGLDSGRVEGSPRLARQAGAVASSTLSPSGR